VDGSFEEVEPAAPAGGPADEEVPGAGAVSGATAAAATRTQGAEETAPTTAPAAEPLAEQTAYREETQQVPETQVTPEQAGAPSTAAGQLPFGEPAEGPYGPGSAHPAEDGSGPAGWAVKGNTGSMLFHTDESPSYQDTRAEVWFENEEAAKAAGFKHWDRKRR
jgi:hypothetical protein